MHSCKYYSIETIDFTFTQFCDWEENLLVCAETVKKYFIIVTGPNIFFDLVTQSLDHLFKNWAVLLQPKQQLFQNVGCFWSPIVDSLYCYKTHTFVLSFVIFPFCFLFLMSFCWDHFFVLQVFNFFRMCVLKLIILLIIA